MFQSLTLEELQDRWLILFLCKYYVAWIYPVWFEKRGLYEFVLDQVDSSKEASSSNTGSDASGAGGTSRFRRFSFGSQLLQKTVGLVLKPRQGRQVDIYFSLIFVIF